MPSAVAPSPPPPPPTQLKRLVLCFDGTGNDFQGNTSDTNVVKLYDKLDRDDNNQYHYYQPGIGTYSISGGSVNKTAWGSMKDSVSKTIDSAFGTTFDAHVMAGYRFLMRYYDSGDKIYMFGFSRGAFTARYLARMVNTIGLLSKGNEEMVPFAYKLYQDYETGKDPNAGDESQTVVNGNVPTDDEHQPLLHDPQQVSKRDIIKAFAETFCRRERVSSGGESADGSHYSGVRVYFLGIFDCVGSVGALTSPKNPCPIVGTAQHVRHAVAVDERRVKFKPALLEQDTKSNKATHESHKEVWFPGNHGDVGGGWAAPKEDSKKREHLSWGEWFKHVFWTDKDSVPSKGASFDHYQMSDIPLAWMIRELETVGAEAENADYALAWNPFRLEGFKYNFKTKGMQQEQALTAEMHDTLRFGWGVAWTKVLLWRFQECLPLARFELVKGLWVTQRTPNRLSTRDVPKSALLHQSVLWRLTHETGKYKPKNNHGDDVDSTPCIVPENFVKCRPSKKDLESDPDGFHVLYTLKQKN
ncbi:hypothetical protein FH972_022410 [Carpinus fangiana]|uniref:T6SS Phospholipase effector Tle1-like catalytic domain-containing protein n=1 Tax=Carpinus fangiana TaxID=176857 RepID=A0A5N6KSH4_9ROSI|nr:hypothetical protein FH972_022410 [Carpinus fangiana]